MCKRLITNIDVLRRLIVRREQYELVPFAVAFTKLNNVRVACFGKELEPNMETTVSDFRTAYLDLGVSVTTAAHVIMNHVVQFCRFHQSALGKYSEQASESVHRDFANLWEKCGKVSISHSKYGSNLLETTIRYNGRHI